MILRGQLCEITKNEEDFIFDLSTTWSMATSTCPRVNKLPIPALLTLILNENSGAPTCIPAKQTFCIPFQLLSFRSQLSWG